MPGLFTLHGNISKKTVRFLFADLAEWKNPMPWYDFFWYDENVEHLAEHGVTPEEFEEVVIAATMIETSDSGSDMVRGKTSAGRYLVCIFDQIDDVSVIPVTAYEPTKGNE